MRLATVRTRGVRVLIAVGAIGIVVALAFAVLRPHPARLAVTARAGDDTVVINRIRPAQLRLSVLDQYGRPVRPDAAVRYQRVSGDTVGLSVSAGGKVLCGTHSDAVVRASFERLSKDFVLRCRPVATIEAPTWLDLVVGDKARDLTFVAHGPDGRAVTELRGAVTVPDGSIVAVEGATLRPRQAGQTEAIVEVGDSRAVIPILVYQQVSSFVHHGPRDRLLAMHVRLARGDTIELPLPKAAFWVTYFPSDRGVAPPTIKLRGDGACTTGDGVRLRRIVEGEYAKYCLTGSGTRMMIAQGQSGADVVNGVVAIRLMW